MKKTEKDVVDKYNPDVQKILLSILVGDTDLFAKCRTIIREEYFDDEFRPPIRFVLDHAETYRAIPTTELIAAKTGLLLSSYLPEQIKLHREWFCNDFEAFCRYRATENAILDGVQLLEQGRGDEIAARLKDALTIRLMSDLGTDYFEDPEARLRRMLSNMATIPTGWKLLDDKLFGGFVRGGLNLFLANSGVGKSLVLQNLSLNWSFMGYHVVYFTLELGEDHTALKMDAMVTGIGTREIVRNISDAALAVKMKVNKNKPGSLLIKKYPEGGTNCNDFRAYLKEYEIVHSHPPDALIIDYLDLVWPNDNRVDPSNLFIKDKFVSEEIRALMHETNTFGASASQMTRGAIEAQGEFDQSHTAGGISKINTSDTAIALYAPPSHKERGEFDFKFLKTRSSSGVGQTVKLSYDPTCMRITDPMLTMHDVEQPASTADLRKEVAAKTSATPTETDSLDDRLNKLIARKRDDE